MIKLLTGIAIVATAWMLSMALTQVVHATPLPLPQSQETPSKYQRPEDMLQMVPFISEIPRAFLLGNGYRVKLGADSLRIDHMGVKSPTHPEARNCMIGFSYTTPVMGFFTSRVDLPLVYSPSPRVADWTFSRLGDYTAQFSQGTRPTALLRLVISAKF